MLEKYTFLSPSLIAAYTVYMNSTPVTKQYVLDRFKLFQGGTGGLDSWLQPDTQDEVFNALADLETHPLTRARFNQLLTLAHEAPVSQPLFAYYWLEAPTHSYDVRNLPAYDERWPGSENIHSIEQLYWGLYRFYVDALLYFGSIRTAYQRLRQLSEIELRSFFTDSRIEALTERGEALLLSPIARDNRYLISEMACKSFDIGDQQGNANQLEQVMLDLFQEHRASGGGPVTVKELLIGEYAKRKYKQIEVQLELSADDFIEETVEDEDAIRAKIHRVSEYFTHARALALKNTSIYLSMVGDLDVYVATSMRSRTDFREMAGFCETVFGSDALQSLRLRYFDPTLSAAEHHEDKGIIECLMVKCAKVLLLNAGRRDSYGKDAEAAMALSLGKPVIIFADEDFRSSFFRDVHPLSRLIKFDTGVAVGAMVATSPDQVIDLLHRIFTNTLEYELVQPRPQYLVLREKCTQSVVRLQTSDILLRETFWNHYHNRMK